MISNVIFFSDFNKQLILEFKNSFENIIQCFQKILKGLFLDMLYNIDKKDGERMMSE